MGTHNHHHDYNFSEQYTFAGTAKIVSLVAIVFGVATIAYGLLTDGNLLRTYSNLLLMGYYFTCVCAAGAFFVALQLVTQSGWSAGMMRIPQAMSAMLPIASILL